MVEIFKAFVISSAVGAVLSLVLALLRPITRKIFSCSWHYYMNIAVLLVMIFPIKLNFPQGSAAAKGIQSINIVFKEQTNITFSQADTVYDGSNSLSEMSHQFQSQGTDINISDVALRLSYVWLGIALLLLLVRVSVYIAFIVKMRRQSHISSCPELVGYTKRKIRVRTSEKLSSPLMIGVFFPTLLLPKAELSPEQLHNILSHEMTHLKRNDLLYKWLAGLVKCVCWYNPAVYFVSKQANIDCEISCDLEATKNMSDGQKASYIETILSLLSHNHSKAASLTTGMANNKKILKRRFIMIKNKKNISKKTKILSALLAVMLFTAALLASGVLAKGVETDANTEKNNASSNFDKNAYASSPVLNKNDAKDDLKALKEELDGLKSEYQERKNDSGTITDTATVVWPVDSKEITQKVCNITDPFTGEVTQHCGVDILSPEGTAVYASISGEVTEAGYDSVLGNFVVISGGNGVSVKYGHLCDISVSKGAFVEQGRAVGTVGQTGHVTGPCLHFEVKIGEKQCDVSCFLDSNNHGCHC